MAHVYGVNQNKTQQESSEFPEGVWEGQGIPVGMKITVWMWPIERGTR